MVSQTGNRESDAFILVDQVTKIQDLVETIRDDAVTFALSKLTPFQRTKELEMLIWQHEFLSHFKCGLAKGIGDTLLSHDEQVRTVYLFEPSANPDAVEGIEMSADAAVHLLVRVKKRSAALNTLISAMDKALTASVKKLGWSRYSSYRSVIDIIPITDEDIEQRKGFAALLTSVISPPIRVCGGR